MKKLLLVFLSIFLVFGILVCGNLPLVLADDPDPAEIFTYDVLNDEVTITGLVDRFATTVNIPDEIEGYPVTSIGDYAFEGCGLISVTIPNSVTDIGDYAFEGCYLTSVTIPNSVTSIGSYAFQYCSNLTEINISNSVTSIGEGTFSHCSRLMYINIPDSVTSIGDYAFNECSNLTSITIPNSITAIGIGTFRGCGLISVTIPNSVTDIGETAFQHCSNLTEINIPDSVTSIGKGAFAGCSRLIEITIPNSVTDIGDFAFTACSSLIEINISNSVTSIGEGTFSHCSRLMYINIPDSVTDVGTGAFAGCDLRIAIIPNSITSIGDFAFEGCSGLTDIYYNGRGKEWRTINVSRTGNDALLTANIRYKGEWEDPNEYEPIENPDDGSVIVDFVGGADGDNKDGKHGFFGPYSGGGDMAKLTQKNGLVVNFSVQDSYVSAEVSPQSMGSMRYAILDIKTDNPEAIDGFKMIFGGFGKNWNEWSKTALTTYYQKICVNLYASGVNDPNHNITNNGADISFRKGNARGGNIYVRSITFTNELPPSEEKNPNPAEIFTYDIIDDETIITGLVDEKVATINIPNRIEGYPVTSIGDYAFNECSNLTSVTISSSVTSIGDYAFNECSNLTSITIPNSITAIGNGTFRGCSLTSVTIPSSVKSIGDYAFEGNNSLSYMYIPDSITSFGRGAFSSCSKLIYINIPDSVTSIGGYAFQNCSRLKYINIPDSVTDIRDYTFSGCSSLKSVNILSGVTSIGDFAFAGCNGLTDIYYNGTREEWNAINVSLTGNDDLLTANIHYKDDVESNEYKPAENPYNESVVVDFVGGADGDNKDGKHGFFGPYSVDDMAKLTQENGLVVNLNLQDSWVTAEVSPQSMGSMRYAILDIKTDNPEAIAGFMMTFGGINKSWSMWKGPDGNGIPALTTYYQKICVDLYASGLDDPEHNITRENNGADISFKKGNAPYSHAGGGYLYIRSITFTNELASTSEENPDVDIEVTRVATSQSVVNDGDDINVYCMVRNSGSEDTTRTIKVDFYFNGKVFDTVYINDVIPAGGFKVIQSSKTKSTFFGVHKISAIINSDENQFDKEKSNNTLKSRLIVND